MNKDGSIQMHEHSCIANGDTNPDIVTAFTFPYFLDLVIILSLYRESMGDVSLRRLFSAPMSDALGGHEVKVGSDLER